MKFTAKWPFIISKREPFENLMPNDSVVIVIGPTGSGKSTVGVNCDIKGGILTGNKFINKAAAADANLLDVVKKTADGKTSILEPVTNSFQYVRCTSTAKDSRRLVFVDTPAIPNPDGSSSSEKEVRNMNEWLKKAVKNHIKIAGILYLHNVTIKRLTESPLLYREMFRNLCGKEYSASMLLVLTMCENIDPESRMTNEGQMKELWKQIIGEKGVVCCHYGTTESAWEALKVVGVELVDLSPEVKN